MPERDPEEVKREHLRRRGCLNRQADAVEDEHFAGSDFFDPADVVQVKYEMLRRVRVEGESVTRAAGRFGRSRPAYYAAEERFEAEGLAGLMPRKPGPKDGHKLSAEVVDDLEKALRREPELDATELARRVSERFGVEVHPRSVERALARRKKNPGGRP